MYRVPDVQIKNITTLNTKISDYRLYSLAVLYVNTNDSAGYFKVLSKSII